jgi:hypothetical protein
VTKKSQKTAVYEGRDRVDRVPEDPPSGAVWHLRYTSVRSTKKEPTPKLTCPGGFSSRCTSDRRVPAGGIRLRYFPRSQLPRNK